MPYTLDVSRCFGFHFEHAIRMNSHEMVKNGNSNGFDSNPMIVLCVVCSNGIAIVYAHTTTALAISISSALHATLQNIQIPKHLSFSFLFFGFKLKSMWSTREKKILWYLDFKYYKKLRIFTFSISLPSSCVLMTFTQNCLHQWHSSHGYSRSSLNVLYDRQYSNNTTYSIGIQFTFLLLINQLETNKETFNELFESWTLSIVFKMDAYLSNLLLRDRLQIFIKCKS